MNKGLTFAFASMIALSLVGCNKGSTDIATVNGAPITESEFYDYLETKTSFTVSPAGVTQQQLMAMQQGRSVNMRVPAKQTPGMQALRDLVTRKVTEQLAKEDGFEATKEMIDEEINFQKELDEGFVKNLQQNMGMSMEQIRRQIGFELAQQHLITKGIEVTDKDLDDFIEANRESRFTEPATVNAHMIVVNTAEEAAAVDSELAKGRRFADVAMELSKDPLKEDRGARFPIEAVPAFPAPIRTAVENVQPNETTDWIQLNENERVKLYVNARTQAKEMDMTGAKREQVRRQLKLQRGQQGKDINETLLKEVVSAEVDLKKSTLKSMWTDYKKELEKELERLETETTTVPSSPEGP